MFTDHGRVTVTKEFTEGQSDTFVFLVKAQKKGNGSELPVIVKLGPAHLIEEEWHATRTFTEGKLPGFVPIKEEPVFADETAPDGTIDKFGAAKYGLAGDGIFEVQTLRDYVGSASSQSIYGLLIKRLFPQLTQIWHDDESLPVNRTLGSSYDRVLPVNLLIQADPSITSATSRLDASRPTASYPPAAIGDSIELRNFEITALEHTDRSITLNLPLPLDPHEPRADSFRLRVTGIKNLGGFKRKEAVASIHGQVVATRQSLLEAAIGTQLGPQVNLAAPTLALPHVEQRVPNPFVGWPDLLQQQAAMRIGTVHGDLNMGNVLVDVGIGSPLIIDCLHAHRDHALYDLIRLEAETLLHLFSVKFRDSALQPAQIYEIYSWLDHMMQRVPEEEGHFTIPHSLLDAMPTLKEGFMVLTMIRNGARKHLVDPFDWREYYVGLALTLLGSIKFQSLDRAPTGTQPKAIAFWGAATIMKLLDEPADETHIGWELTKVDDPPTASGAESGVQIVYDQSTHTNQVHHDHRQGTFIEGNESVNITGDLITGGTVNKTNFNGPVTGPIHTGSGDIRVGDDSE